MSAGLTTPGKLVHVGIVKLGSTLDADAHKIHSRLVQDLFEEFRAGERLVQPAGGEILTVDQETRGMDIVGPEPDKGHPFLHQPVFLLLYGD